MDRNMWFVLAIFGLVLFGASAATIATMLHWQSRRLWHPWAWRLWGIVAALMLWPWTSFWSAVTLFAAWIAVIEVTRTTLGWRKANPRNKKTGERPNPRNKDHLRFLKRFYLTVIAYVVIAIFRPELVWTVPLVAIGVAGIWAAFYQYSLVGVQAKYLEKVKDKEGNPLTRRNKWGWRRRYTWVAPTATLMAGFSSGYLAVIREHLPTVSWVWWLALVLNCVTIATTMFINRWATKAQKDNPRKWWPGVIAGAILTCCVVVVGYFTLATSINASDNLPREGNDTETTDVVAESEDNKCPDEDQTSANTPHWGKSATTVFRIYPPALAFALEEEGLVTSDEATTIRRDPEGGCLTEETRDLYDALVAETTEQRRTDLWHRYCDKDAVVCPGQPD